MQNADVFVFIWSQRVQYSPSLRGLSSVKSSTRLGEGGGYPRSLSLYLSLSTSTDASSMHVTKYTSSWQFLSSLVSKVPVDNGYKPTEPAAIVNISHTNLMSKNLILFFMKLSLLIFFISMLLF